MSVICMRLVNSKALRIAARLVLFICVTTLISPLPGRLVDFEYLQSQTIARFFYDMRGLNNGTYSEMQDFTFVMLLETTSLAITVIIMVIAEAMFKRMLRLRRKRS